MAVTAPADGAHVSAKTVTFSGQTEPGATVRAGTYAATVGADGGWSLALVLSPGANTVTFEATDVAGNTARASVTVSFDPPAPPPTEPDKPSDGCVKTGDGCEGKDGCVKTGDGCEGKDGCVKTGDGCNDDPALPDPACTLTNTGCIEAPLESS